MQAKIHPKWYPNAQIKCACGNVTHIGATVPEITVEVCAACHPYYTGKMTYIDTAGRVDAFKAKRKNAKKKVLSKTERRKIKKMKRIKEELSRPETLEELRRQLKAKKN